MIFLGRSGSPTPTRYNGIFLNFAEFTASSKSDDVLCCPSVKIITDEVRLSSIDSSIALEISVPTPLAIKSGKLIDKNSELSSPSFIS